jgi:hypothetical protein
VVADALSWKGKVVIEDRVNRIKEP